ncbi:hypothetical protein QFC21_003418 [Naganishia friedmannii]|uniref:Uncharacterized protein n=1 Tax=Naganishia friedmannii TaxID=89922 RepID=A0ACC2VP55_9TREE|nr:hypothetical protein QFC21_003418 [Naganishia friedmannii]
MQIAVLFASLLATASIAAYGQTVDSSVGGAYVASVLSAMNAANLTAFVNAAQAVANTTEGDACLAAINQTYSYDRTLFAPTNEAFAKVSESVSSNTTLLANILSYHLLDLPVEIRRSKSGGFLSRTGHSLYNNGLLPGNEGQLLVMAAMNTTQTGNLSLVFPYQKNNETVYGSTSPVPGTNFTVYPIDAVLTLPQPLNEAATTFFPSLAGIVQQAGLLEPLIKSKGITVLAPNDDAISAVSALFGTLNSTQLQAVLMNHVINGTVAYSTPLGDTLNYTSAGGEPLKFLVKATGAYVTSGETTARILHVDIPIANGVVHIIDRVLTNSNSNTAAAESAASSYAVQATATSSGAGSSPTMGSATGAASGAATSAKASTAMLSVPFSSGVVGSVVAIFVGIFAGATLS